MKEPTDLFFLNYLNQHKNNIFTKENIFDKFVNEFPQYKTFTINFMKFALENMYCQITSLDKEIDGTDNDLLKNTINSITNSKVFQNDFNSDDYHVIYKSILHKIFRLDLRLLFEQKDNRGLFSADIFDINNKYYWTNFVQLKTLIGLMDYIMLFNKPNFIYWLETYAKSHNIPHTEITKTIWKSKRIHRNPITINYFTKISINELIDDDYINIIKHILYLNEITEEVIIENIYSIFQNNKELFIKHKNNNIVSLIDWLINQTKEIYIKSDNDYISKINFLTIAFLYLYRNVVVVVAVTEVKTINDVAGIKFDKFNHLINEWTNY